MKLILVIDDHNETGDLQKALGSSDFTVKSIPEARANLNEIISIQPDILIMEAKTHVLDGLYLCMELRKKNIHSRLPVIFRSNHFSENDKILGLEVGGDDYVEKKISVKELAHRIRAILRRTNMIVKTDKVVSGNLVLYVNAYKITLNDEEILFGLIEFRLLWELMRNKGIVLTREKLIQSVWDGELTNPRIVDVHIRGLRKQLEENPSKPKRIVTSRGNGYCFVE